MRFVPLLWLALVPISLYAVNDLDRQQIQQRIAPVGNIRVLEGVGFSAALTISQEKKMDVQAEPGQETYEQYCVICHRDGVAGAPKFRDAADWEPRLVGKDINALLAIVLKGLNAMPVKGSCIECNEAELKAAIEYMVPKS